MTPSTNETKKKNEENFFSHFYYLKFKDFEILPPRKMWNYFFCFFFFKIPISYCIFYENVWYDPSINQPDTIRFDCIITWWSWFAGGHFSVSNISETHLDKCEWPLWTGLVVQQQQQQFTVNYFFRHCGRDLAERNRDRDNVWIHAKVCMRNRLQHIHLL